MRRRLLAVSLAALIVALANGGRAGAASRSLEVTVGRTAISTTLGHKFVFRSTIANRSSIPATGLIAHLNVLSLKPDVYVDPEDWSSHRTRYLAPIPPGGSTTITWRMQAVNHGEFGVYVAVLPEGGALSRPTTGRAIKVAIASRTTINSGGILPLALGIPGLLGLLTLGLRLRRNA